jgi:F1F0 ATPase subunit 2
MSVETLALGLLVGLLVGVAYFQGLWWTAVRLPRARHPWRLLAASYGLRTALTLGSFALLVRLGPESLLAALVGFASARVLVVRRRARLGAVTAHEAGGTPERTEANDDPLA